MEWQKCDICNKSFTGIVSFKEHEESKKHQRKVKALKLNITESYKPQLKSCKKCLECNKVFNGPIPYMQHLKSSFHKKKIQAKRLKNNPIGSLLPVSMQRNQEKGSNRNSENSMRKNTKKSRKRNSKTNPTPFDTQILRNSQLNKIENVQIQVEGKKLKFSFEIEFPK
ncbi:hypothetical protein TNCT_113481 [Trichonephila clavata]|uniref:C2H2-type domain-containing protein n=1 Tax=Trichonephila clavata TaxID=2740835 RepID=A0A8X6FD84_TRICU|nr:hypothetical protein TNCT_113481 [Trichonephila clavata]